MSNRGIAVVTGASSGIGKAVFEWLKRQGIPAVGLARRFGDSAETRHLDVRSVEGVRAVFESLLKERGAIDILVNCAGQPSVTDPLEISSEEWDEVFRTNVRGTWLCCREVLPGMRERKKGRIINVSSIAGRHFSLVSSPAYTASKYAVIGMTKQLAVQFARHGIYVNCVCPSQTVTEMSLDSIPAEKRGELERAHPMRRLARPEEVAEVIGFLAGEGASYINGAAIDVNGGLL